MNNIKLSVIILLCFMLLISPVFAENQNIAHVVASDFVFVYNDGTTTSKYEGDQGLDYAMFNDTLTGICYHVRKDFVRGIAYATDKKFNIKNFTFEYTKYQNDDFRYVGDVGSVGNITLDNGTVIIPLSIDMDLTPRQKKYFDDYETQLNKYYDDKLIKQMESNAFWASSLDNQLSISNRIATNRKSSGKFYGYTSGGSYMYGRYS